MEKFIIDEATPKNIVRAYLTINGKQENLFYAKKVNAVVQKTKSIREGEEKVLWRGTGVMSMYAITPFFRDLMKKSIETGEEIYFDMVVISQESEDLVGEEKITFKDCNLESISITIFDVDEEILGQMAGFTYKNFLINTK